jgi:hypothetical protein
VVGCKGNIGMRFLVHLRVIPFKEYFLKLRFLVQIGFPILEKTVANKLKIINCQAVSKQGVVFAIKKTYNLKL